MEYQVQYSNKQYFLFKIFIIFYLHELEDIDFNDISFILDEQNEIIKSYYLLSISKMKKRISGGIT